MFALWCQLFYRTQHNDYHTKGTTSISQKMRPAGSALISADHCVAHFNDRSMQEKFTLQLSAMCRFERNPCIMDRLRMASICLTETPVNVGHSQKSNTLGPFLSVFLSSGRPLPSRHAMAAIVRDCMTDERKIFTLLISQKGPLFKLPGTEASLNDSTQNSPRWVCYAKPVTI